MKVSLIHSSDDDDYDTQELDEDEEDDNDYQKLNNTVCWTEMYHNIIRKGNTNVEVILHLAHSDINEEHLVTFFLIST